MQGSVWAALLRRVPAEQMNQLMLVMAGGTEIALQAVLLYEQDFMAIKGRLAGSQDAGRVYFIPYERIDYLGTTREVKEAEFEATFGNFQIPGRDDAPEPVTPVTPVAPAAPAVPSAPVPSGSTGSGYRPPIKSEVLERFRARGGSSSNNGTTLRPSVNG